MHRLRSTKALATMISILFAISLAAAVRSPATGYELNIYASTPITVWIVLGGIAVTGIGAVVWTSGTTRTIGAISLTSIPLFVVSLPLLRSYYFLGKSDPQTYLGFSRHVVQEGTVSGMFYPFFLTLAATLSEVTGMPLTQSWLLILCVVSGLFIVGVVVAVRSIDPRQGAVVGGLLVSGLFLPVNQITRAGVFTPPSTTTLTIFLIPLLLFLLLRVWDDNRPEITAVAGVYILAILFAHPQQGVNAILVCLSLGVIVVLRSQFISDHRMPHSRYFTVALCSSLVFWIWVSGADKFTSSIRVIAFRLLQPTPTGDVSDAGSSLTAVGGSIPELFVKLFLISALACAIVGIATAVAISPERLVPNRLKQLGNMRANEFALALAIVPVGGLALVYVFVLSQYFRHIGFIMAIVSVLAPLALVRQLRAGRPYRAATKVAASGLLAVILVLTVLSMQFSPWVFQDSHHVTEAEIEGYEHLFEKGAESDDIAYLRIPNSRYHDNIYGHSGSRSGELESRSSNVVYNLHTAVSSAEHDTYYVVTEGDRQREFELYQEVFLKQEEVAFLALESDRIYYNGEVELYQQEESEDD